MGVDVGGSRRRPSVDDGPYVTGNGLKTVDALEASMGPALEVRPTIEWFEAAAERSPIALGVRS